MKRHRLVLIAASLLLLHTVEEVVTSFSQTDAWSLAAAQLTHSNSTTVYWIGQPILFGFLAWMIITRPKASAWYWLLGAIMVFELDHVIRAIALRAYYPGLVTAIAILIFAISYWRLLLQSPSKSL